MEKKNKGILIIALILVVVGVGIWLYIKFFVTKQVGGTRANAPGKAPAAAPSSSGSGSSPIVVKTDAQNAGINTAVAATPALTVSQNLSVGADVFAGNSLLNVYTSCDFTSNSIVTTFYQGQYIGTYIGLVGECLQVSIDNTYWATIPLFGSVIPIGGGSTTGYITTAGTDSIYYKNPLGSIVTVNTFVQTPPIDADGCDANGFDQYGFICPVA